jgi:hypothetical protein
MTSESTLCPLCNLEASRVRGVVEQNFQCMRCGHFQINNFRTTISEIGDLDKRYLSSATRQAHEEGLRLILDFDNLADLVATHRASTISGKVEKPFGFWPLNANTQEVTA